MSSANYQLHVDSYSGSGEGVLQEDVSGDHLGEMWETLVYKHAIKFKTSPSHETWKDIGNKT